MTLNLDNLRLHNPRCVQAIIQDPSTYHKIASEWIASTLGGESKLKTAATKLRQPRVSFEGNLGANFVTPRGLCSRMTNQLVGLQGIVTRTSISRYQLQKSVHWCEKTGTQVSKLYPDYSAPEDEFDIKKNKTLPLNDIHGNPLKLEFGRSTFKDHETGVLQELPEMAPPGLLPRSSNFLLPSDLIDEVKPGDRVQMVGVYRVVPNYQSKESGILKPVFIVTSVTPLTTNPSPLIETKLTIKLPYPEEGILDLFALSVSPSISGHTQLKKAVLLMLLGGVEKTLDNNGHLRGDINLLMVGDPGTAKSQMLRWVLATVDVGVNTTGSGASGVGLTAAITYDKDSGEKSIEAGAMVLADRGFVCIDEFDKMEEADRVAVHEVMEQQTVTIAKAGIHCSLNARCSVIAAANPIYGEYQRDKTPSTNIGMPDSLLSRFDLIFVIIDEKEPENDRRIAERVCRNHRYANVELLNETSVQEGFVIQPLDTVAKNEDLIFEKSPLWKGEGKVELLTQTYLRKYVNFCRRSMKPVLTEEAVELLANLWACLREKEVSNRSAMETKVLPVTIRSYETLIRLSTAHAKLRLSSEVEITDCVEAFRLMVYTLYKDETQLDKDLRDCIRKVAGDSYDLTKRHRTSKKVKQQEEPEDKDKSSRKKVKKEEDMVSLANQIRKIDLGKEDQVIDQLFSSPASKKKLISEIFVAFTKLTAAKKTESCTLKELKEKLPHLDEAVLTQALRDMDQSDKILFNEDKGQVHTV